MYSYRFAVEHSNKLKCPPSVWITFLTRVTRELVTLRNTVVLRKVTSTLVTRVIVIIIIIIIIIIITIIKVKVKVTLVQALRLCTGRTAHTGSRGIALLFHDHGTRRGWGVSVTPRPLFTPGKTRYPLYRRLCGPQGRFGQVRKISPPPGFDPRTVQPVASRYTDWATWLTYIILRLSLIVFNSILSSLPTAFYSYLPIFSSVSLLSLQFVYKRLHLPKMSEINYQNEEEWFCNHQWHNYC